MGWNLSKKVSWFSTAVIGAPQGISEEVDDPGPYLFSVCTARKSFVSEGASSILWVLVSRQDPSRINGKVGPFTSGNYHSPSLLAPYFLRTFLPLDT